MQKSSPDASLRATGEYLLEDALFTSPPHPQWGGAALVGQDGRLLGVGSLLVQETVGSETVDANMFVPIDLLDPILEDMKKLGRAARSPRPWLGMYTRQCRAVSSSASSRRAALRTRPGYGSEMLFWKSPESR